MLYEKNNAAALDSSQSLVTSAPSTASLPVQKQTKTKALHVLVH